MDFEETILLTSGNFLWSNRSQIMMEIVMDTNGRNDILLAPCSQETFNIMYDNPDYHPSCLENLYTNLKSYRLTVDDIPTAFNVFMNVQFDKKGKLKVLAPTTVPGDMLRLVAKMDVIIGMTACSAENSNGGSFKPNHYVITDADGLLNP